MTRVPLLTSLAILQWEGFQEMLENAWRTMAYADVQSATTISHMSSGNGAISDTFPKDKAGMQSSTTSPSSVLQVSPLNSLSMIAIREETRHREKDTSFGLPLPASMSANTAAKDNRDHTSFVLKKAQLCYSY